MKKSKSNILILGADGFIASNLTKALVREKKFNIRAFDIFRNNETRNLEDVRNKIELFSGNFLNRDDLRRSLQGIDYVFHYISLTTPGSSINDSLIDVEANIKGSVILFDECVKAKVKRIIFSSSGGAIYGNQSKNKISEVTLANPVSPYAISKLAIEKYLEFYRIHFGIDYLILRYSNPYGPGQNIVGSQGIVTIFLNLIKNSEPVIVFGDGKNIRDFIYIDDAIRITKSIFNKETTLHKIYNVGSGCGASINEVIGTIRKITNNKIKINRLPRRDIDVRKIVLDTRRIREEFNFKPELSLEEGIKKTWDWMVNLTV